MVVFFSSPFCSCVAFLTMIFLLLGSGGWFHCSWTKTGEHALAIIMACVLSGLYGVIYFFAVETEQNSSIRVRWVYLVATALDLLCLIVALAVSNNGTSVAVVLVLLFTMMLQLPRSFNIWNFIFTQVEGKPSAEDADETGSDTGSGEVIEQAERQYTTRISRNVRFRQPTTIFGADFGQKD